MSADEKKGARISRGPKIVAALAETLPRAMTRREFLESSELAAKFGKEKLTAREVAGAAKALGLLIKNGEIEERLIISPRGHYGAGLVAVSVSLSSLRDEWRSAQRHSGDAPSSMKLATQECIVQKIIDDTKVWVRSASIIDEHVSEENDPFKDTVPIVIRDINVVHGSESFDILMFVLYRRQKEFLTYIREVVQRVPCVERTHTMQIALHS